MHAPTPDQLRLVQRLLGWEQGSFECRALSGGLNNRSFELTRGGERHALRIRADVAGAALLAADLELRLLDVVAAAGLGPAVRASDAAGGILISEFLATAHPWAPEAAQPAGRLEQLAALLRRLHGVDFALPSLRTSEVLARYLDDVEAMPGREPELARWQQELCAVLRWYAARFEAVAVCHNDLVADNILDDGHRLWLIDFEYAVRAHPILDLASLAAMNALDPPACAALCAAYYGCEQPPFSRQEFVRVVRMQQLLAYFWVLWSMRVMPTAQAWDVQRARWIEILRQGEK